MEKQIDAERNVAAWDDPKRRLAQGLVWVIEAFRKCDGEMQAQTMGVFLVVAANPEIRMKEIAHLLGMSSSSVSRNVRILSSSSGPAKPGSRKRPKGLGLITVESDLSDGRVKRVSLTPRGRSLYKKVTLIVQAAAENNKSYE